MTLNRLPIFDPAAQNSHFSQPMTQQPASDKVSGQADLARRSAWLREMERAQIAHWFMRFENRGPANVPSITPNARPSIALQALAIPATTKHEKPAVAAANATTASPLPGETAQNFSPPGAVDEVPPLTASLAASPGMKGEHIPASTLAAEKFEAGTGDPRASGASRNDLISARRLTAHLAQALNGHLASLAESTRPVSLNPGPVSSSHSMLPLITLTHPVNLEVRAVATARLATATATTQAALGPMLDFVAPSDGDAQHANQAGSSTRIAPRLALRPGDHTRIRLHAQWIEEAVTVWLGMDGSPAQIASQASVVIAELQRHLGSQGQRLSRVICNGQVFFDSAMQTTPVQIFSFPEALARQISARPPSLQTVTRDDSVRRSALAGSFFPSPTTPKETP